MRWRVVAVAAIAVASSREAAAQCGAQRSTCSGCHDARAPYAAGAQWHEDHAFADLCASCHGGHADATAAAEAHIGIEAPEAACKGCHGAQEAALAARYRAEPTSTVSAPAPAPAGGAPGRHGLTGAPRANALAGLGILVAAAVLALVVLRRRWRLVLRAAIARSWPPAIAGVGLGLVVTVSVALFGHRLSGAGAYEQLSGVLGRRLAPDAVFWRHVLPSGITWDVLVLLGAIAGALFASRLSHDFGLRTMPDRQWTEVFGPSVVRRWLLAFLGSFLTEIGAGLAGGCTASLAVSGGAVLSPAAFVFIAGMFAGGIPTALLVYRRKRD